MHLLINTDCVPNLVVDIRDVPPWLSRRLQVASPGSWRFISVFGIFVNISHLHSHLDAYSWKHHFSCLDHVFWLHHNQCLLIPSFSAKFLVGFLVWRVKTLCCYFLVQKSSLLGCIMLHPPSRQSESLGHLTAQLGNHLAPLRFFRVLRVKFGRLFGLKTPCNFDDIFAAVPSFRLYMFCTVYSALCLAMIYSRNSAGLAVQFRG